MFFVLRNNLFASRQAHHSIRALFHPLIFHTSLKCPTPFFIFTKFQQVLTRKQQQRPEEGIDRKN